MLDNRATDCPYFHHCEYIELGMLALNDQEIGMARQWLQNGLRSAVVDYHYWGIAYAFEALAIVAAATQQGDQAFTLAGAAGALRQITHTASYSHMAAHLSQALASLAEVYTPAAAWLPAIQQSAYFDHGRNRS